MLISLSLMRQRSSLNMLKASWKLFVKRSRHVKKTDRYLYWSKDKKESENSVTATYMSCEKVKCCSSQEFASDLLVNLKALREHGQRMISQYRRIKEINKTAPDHSQKSLYFRVDWSQNWNFFHARQEKWAYYHELQVLINAVVAYMSTNVLTAQYLTLSHIKPQLCGLYWRRSLVVLTWIGYKFFILSLRVQLVSTVTNIILIWQKNVPSNIIYHTGIHRIWTRQRSDGWSWGINQKRDWCYCSWP